MMTKKQIKDMIKSLEKSKEFYGSTVESLYGDAIKYGGEIITLDMEKYLLNSDKDVIQRIKNGIEYRKGVIDGLKLAIGELKKEL